MTLASVPALEPSVLTAPAVPVSQPDRQTGWTWSSGLGAQRSLRFAAGSLASVIALTGVAVASGRSLPGDPFYPAKRATESLELRTASGAAAKGAKQFSFAANRLDEIRRLTHDEVGLRALPGTAQAGGLAFGGSLTSRVHTALRDMDTESRAGNTLLTQAFQQSGQLAPLRVIAQFSQQQGGQLHELMSLLPRAARDQAEVSLGLVTQLGVQAQLALGTAGCTDGCTRGGVLPSPTAAPGSTQPSSAQPSSTQPTSAQPSSGQPTATDRATPGGSPDPQQSCPCATSSPAQPEPSASPSPDPDQPTGSPTTSPTARPTPSPAKQPTPTQQPTPRPTPAASPSPSPTAGPLPVPLPVPVPLPSPLPTKFPTAPVPGAARH